MPTAWEELVAKSTAPPGSTAWEHLISQAPGGGGGGTGQNYVTVPTGEMTLFGEDPSFSTWASGVVAISPETVEINFTGQEPEWFVSGPATVSPPTGELNLFSPIYGRELDEDRAFVVEYVDRFYVVGADDRYEVVMADDRYHVVEPDDRYHVVEPEA